ncbi:MAG: 5-aminopentanamidase [Anaerophaga sp.]|nr:5-aminopentanamidase [Anaerophaga sp.]
MNSRIKTGILQFAPVIGDIVSNIRKIDQLLDNAPGVQLWVLPELASSGYNFASKEEARQSAEPLGESLFIRYLTEKAEKLNAWFVSGFNELDGDKLYNSAVLISPQGLAGHYRKLHLFNREKEIFEPGNTGLPVFSTPYGKTGILVCFDWMFPESWRILALKGAQIICHPSNLVLPWCQNAIPGYALTNRIFVATANRVGTERALTFTGQSVLVNPKGEYLFRGNPDKEDILTADIDLSDALDKQMTPFNHVFADRRPDVYSLQDVNDNHKIKEAKSELRKKIKQEKQKHTSLELKKISIDVMAGVEKLPQFQNAKKVFVYWSLPDEVSTHDFIKRWHGEKRIFLPKVTGKQLEIREFTGEKNMKAGSSFGIQESTGEILANPEEIDIAIVPGLAFTMQGARLGRGGGFYDKTLPLLKKAFKAGVAFPFQMVSTIPTSGNDVYMDIVVTDGSMSQV